MAKNTMTDKARKQRIEAPFKNGMYVLRDRGESALSPVGKSRMQELKELFSTESGRLEYRRDLAVLLALMLDIGFDNIREIADRKGNIWESSPTSRMGVYLNSLMRLIDGWPKDKGFEDITTILKGEAHDKPED